MKHEIKEILHWKSSTSWIINKSQTGIKYAYIVKSTNTRI